MEADIALITSIWTDLTLGEDELDFHSYRIEIDPMALPVRFRHLYSFECRYCHREIDAKTWSQKQKASRTCPFCATALSVEAIPQGEAGSWCGFLRWIDGHEE